jgi:hypothetical protein
MAQENIACKNCRAVYTATLKYVTAPGEQIAKSAARFSFAGTAIGFIRISSLFISPMAGPGAIDKPKRPAVHG